MNAQAPQSLVDWLFANDADDPEWITVNGAHVPLNEQGEPKGKVGKKIREASAADPFGEAFPEYTGKSAEAIEHLLREKRGYVPGAFHKEGLGDIDLAYGKGGKGGFGLAHIIERRNAQGYDGEAFARQQLPEIINEGKVEYRRDFPGRAYIVHEGQEAVIRLDWDGKDRKWLVTAYFQDVGHPPGSDCRTDLNRTCVDRKTTLPAPEKRGSSGERGKFSQDTRLRKPGLVSSRPGLGAESPAEKIVPFSRAVNMEETAPMPDRLTLDAAPSRRHRDENGFLHVDCCHVTREQVAPYCGHEVPGWEALGLDPERLYHVYRPAEELEKAAPTINGLPILMGHSPESADAPQLDRRIGSMGTDASFNAPYLDNSLIFTVQEAIDAIEDGRERELSLSYRYDPDMTPGTFEGQPYDFVMRNLRGNHLALVPAGRAGASCCVADAAPDDGEGWITTENGKHIHFKNGEIDKGNIGQNEWDSPAAQEARRNKVADAMREIANGKEEVTIPGLRNDLEQYGGSNDVTIIRGDAKKGLIHIAERHGSDCIAPVLEAVANGKITRFVKGNKTVHIDKDGYRAVLSLEEHGKKKTWLLTGFDIWDDSEKKPTGDSGKVSARHAPTHAGPILSRPDMGAVGSFNKRIRQLLEKSNHQTRKGGFMGTLKKLFGANDADPETPTPEGPQAPATPADTGPEGGGKPFSMDDAMKAAMDKCGLDAEDPASQAAFAEGVKYGEKLMRDPGEREKLDREHEAEGMEKAEDEEDEEAAAPKAPNAVDEEKVAQAASDAALARFQSILDAQAEVRPHVGEMRVNLARDSAATIYGAALDALGIDRKGTPASAWRGMFKTAVSMRENRAPALAKDAAPVKGPLAGLNNIASL